MPTAPPSPDHTWKEAVARAVLALIQRTGNPAFTIDQIYDFTPDLQALFPGNRHVREKTRQSLQKLVADGILQRTTRGVYQLNTASPELQISTALPGGAHAPMRTDAPIPAGRHDVPTAQRITSVRLRNTLLAIEIKRRYNYQCQVCRKAVHLRPSPHSRLPSWSAATRHRSACAQSAPPWECWHPAGPHAIRPPSQLPRLPQHAAPNTG